LSDNIHRTIKKKHTKLRLKLISTDFSFIQVSSGPVKEYHHNYVPQTVQ
jgi:hypothetical protein